MRRGRQPERRGIRPLVFRPNPQINLADAVRLVKLSLENLGLPPYQAKKIVSMLGGERMTLTRDRMRARARFRRR